MGDFKLHRLVWQNNPGALDTALLNENVRTFSIFLFIEFLQSKSIGNFILYSTVYLKNTLLQYSIP